jgi:adenylate cyclase
VEDSERLPRKLAAILYADVAGYSRLTGDDEDATHRTLSEYLDLISSTVESHRGRVMHYAGDAALAMFDAAVDALAAAIAMQDELKTQNEELPDNRKVQFRVGINLGDVIEDRGDVYGDGVNVAARLESLAEPGEICVSEAIRTAVGTRLPLTFRFLGERRLKNIAEPLRAYRVHRGRDEVENVTRVPGSRIAPEQRKIPSIAVLPFNELGADEGARIFAEGLSEDIITTLSIISSLFVISRHSSFAYRGKGIDVRVAAQELGVRYVLEGSVRKAENQLRVSVQLVDAESGMNVYADRFDRKLSDIFQVQDDITREVVTALRLKLTDGEHARLWWRSTEIMDAWIPAMQGMDYVLRGSAEANLRARELFQRAIEADPNYAFAAAWFAWTHYFDVRFGFSDSQKESLILAEQYARKAIKIDPQSPHAHGVLGVVLAAKGLLRESIEESEAAIRGSPNDAWLKACLARNLIFAGQAERAEKTIRQAIRLNPFFPNYYLGILGNALVDTNREEEAIEPLTMAVNRDPDYFSGHLRLASLHGLAGKITEAHEEASEVLRINPQFDLSKAEAFLGLNNPTLERFIEGLRAAGLPEPEQSQ